MLLTIGTSSRHGDRVSILHQETVSLNFRTVRKKRRDFLARKNLLREDPLSPFQGLNGREKSLKEFFQPSKLRLNLNRMSLLGVMFSRWNCRHTHRNCTIKNDETDHKRCSRVCIKAIWRINLQKYYSGHNNPNI